jgi:hypothetical protein
VFRSEQKYLYLSNFPNFPTTRESTVKLSIDEIKAEVEQGAIKAISIDTSIFDQKQRGLEWGLLKRVQQFKGSSVVFLLSEIVHRELASHLLKDATESESALRKTLKSMSTAWHLSTDSRIEILEIATGQKSADEIAKSRLNSFLKATGAELVNTADHVSITELLGRYFDQQPPFGQKEGKKHEFPDALALLSLERWAELNDAVVLVVSADNDWQNYCSESARLIGINDLAEAFGCFQQQEAGYFCRIIAKNIEEGDPRGLLDAIERAVRAQEDSVAVSVDADSQFRCEEDGVKTQFTNVIIHNSSWEPVEYDGETLVISLTVEISAEITVYFSFEKWDGIDREYVGMGSGQATASEDLSVEVLVTFGGELPYAPVIEDVEVGGISASVSFYDLEPDWMSDPDNFD